MANTFVKIASVTVGAGGAANMSFSSIPSTYTDLVVLLSGRHTGSTASSLGLQLNGTTSTYSSRWLSGNGSSASSSNTAGTSIVATYGSIPGTASTSNTFSNDIIYIPNYTGSSNKSVSSDGVQENNATAAYASLSAGLWSNTAAITSITLFPYDVTNFVQYSTATLYGIKNS